MKLNRMNATYLPEKKKIPKKWWMIDADGQVLGKLACRVSQILRGKDHAYYTPFFDCGDYVIVFNASKVKVTGNKAGQKKYYRHSGYMGNIREISYEHMLKTHPERIVLLAVKNMLPKNRLSRKLLTKLKVYPDAQPRHQAQKPELIQL